MMRSSEEVALQLDIEEHPSLQLATLVANFPQPLSAEESPEWLQALLKPDAVSPVQRTEEGRAAVRDMLRHGGYKPTGRGKPASEYLVKAATEDRLGSINVAVDVSNVVSLHSGVPISVVDLDLAKPPLRVAIASPESRFVFNQAGHEIDVSGLLCLHDVDGPCANAVKDSMRTKTRPETQRLLCIVWGVQGMQPATQAIAVWYRQLLERAGATVE
jgi:DNA/RNA-binding domain of Phe-tRNA-synthetase-like protein